MLFENSCRRHLTLALSTGFLINERRRLDPKSIYSPNITSLSKIALNIRFAIRIFCVCLVIGVHSFVPSHPHRSAVAIAVRMGDWPIALKAEPIEEAQQYEMSLEMIADDMIRPEIVGLREVRE